MNNIIVEQKTMVMLNCGGKWSMARATRRISQLDNQNVD
jgi:hypothetical protein